MPAGRKTRLRVLVGHDIPAERQGHAALIKLIRVYGRLTEAVTRVVKPHGLSLPHFEVLLTLKAGEGISQQDLSERLLVTKGNTCVIVQKMEAAGLIERHSDPADQRFHRLYLTNVGRQTLAKIWPEHSAVHERAIKGLTRGEQKTLYDLMTKLDESFEEES